MKDIEIEHARMESIKADFVKNEVKITISLPLNADTLAMREELAQLAIEGAPPMRVRLEPKRRQLPLSDGVDEVTLSTRGPGGEMKSVTLRGNGSGS